MRCANKLNNLKYTGKNKKSAQMAPPVTENIVTYHVGVGRNIIWCYKRASLSYWYNFYSDMLVTFVVLAKGKLDFRSFLECD